MAGMDSALRLKSKRSMNSLLTGHITIHLRRNINGRAFEMGNNQTQESGY